MCSNEWPNSANNLDHGFKTARLLGYDTYFYRMARVKLLGNPAENIINRQ